MAKTVTVTLREPITGHKGLIHQVTVKSPGLTLFAQHGEPFEVHGDGDKRVYIENDTAIAAYIADCVETPEGNPLLLSQIGLVDAMAVKEALLGFFIEARLALRSHVSPTP